jgi:hypothetical protein
MSDDRDPKVSFRMPAEMRDALDTVCEEYDVSRSALLRRFCAYGLKSNADALGVEAQIDNLRGEIIDFGSPIDDAGGFAGRIRQDFEKRFKNGYAPKWLAAKAENYRREARMLEDKVPEHPDAPPIEDGELVEEVDRVLRETLEAAQLSDWSDRYENPYQKYAGVESGRSARKFALVLTKRALEMDDDLEPLRSALSSERRVRGDDLPELAEEELPPDVDPEDVARVARELADQGLTAEDVETDPTEFDPFGWVDTESVEQAEDTDDAVAVESTVAGELPDADADTEPDGGTAPVADGGDNEAIQAYADQEPDRDVGDLVEWAAEELANDDLTRDTREKRIKDRFEYGTDDWQTQIMDRSTLTPTELIELADDYNDAINAALAGDRQAPPQAVADGNGGVHLE